MFSKRILFTAAMAGAMAASSSAFIQKGALASNVMLAKKTAGKAKVAPK